jgi:hypothetical protein
VVYVATWGTVTFDWMRITLTLHQKTTKDMQHSQLYNIIWSLFESNQIYEELESSPINSMLSELNDVQIKQLIQEICQSIENEPKE